MQKQLFTGSINVRASQQIKLLKLWIPHSQLDPIHPNAKLEITCIGH